MLLATDLDGTFLGGSPEDKAQLSQLAKAAKGYKFGICYRQRAGQCTAFAGRPADAPAGLYYL